MTLSLTQFAALGGKARWRGISKKTRSQIMTELAKKRANKGQKKLSTSTSLHVKK